MDYIVILVGCFSQLIAILWLYIYQNSQVMLLRQISNAAQEMPRIKYHLQCGSLSLHELTKRLYISDKLHSICQDGMVQIYGIPLLFIYFNLIVDAVQIVYMALPKDTLCYKDLLLLIRWMLPLTIYLSLPLLINLEEELKIKSF
ncbi:gustatory and pheromone receptor 39a-like [Drosophila albomicans]|uniref:Gustatory and pheromone receptor 39a-like n=1 Tax=Drosophila albomicans TaxID=7291 RepID=A0A9C6SLF8_DROAB|nr:gustatory and pheromone receptor 39a-like [Drosophila albomicans]